MAVLLLITASVCAWPSRLITAPYDHERLCLGSCGNSLVILLPFKFIFKCFSLSLQGVLCFSVIANLGSRNRKDLMHFAIR